MSRSLCSLHLSISAVKKLGLKIKEGRLPVGWRVGWLGPRWQVVIGVIYHLWKGLRARHTNHTSARCYSRGTAREHARTHNIWRCARQHKSRTNKTTRHMQRDANVIHNETYWIQSSIGNLIYITILPFTKTPTTLSNFFEEMYQFQ